MLPADGAGARTPSPAAARLAAALDRIAAALVRRAEAEAASRDRLEHGQGHAGEHHEAAALETDTVEELRHRVDAAIGRVRAVLGED